MTPDKFSNMPRHVAIIMDGNNRWAKSRGLSGVRGHHAGVESVRAVIKRAAEHHLEAITLFAFSSENWKRPAQEVSALMELFIMALKREVSRLHKNGIRLCIVGDRSKLSSSLNRAIDRAEHLTRHNQGLKLIVAVNYGGRWDIASAAQRLARQVEDGQLSSDDIDEALFEREMSATGIPEVDLCIRTSGEQRISNFILWQMAYAEFYFSPLYWPDFDGDAFDEALSVYSGRKRRFGMTDEQIEVQGA
ncbi:polyprenyl diphosphate synthase [Kushneria konosiri]|uniref:Ditrans,polycis-undecaprenyl-diphosphate synthase ((2E,6E)-farnesyl-diphosphate specific) n=1 Tax=Kushneria konosiri TaxID=698828 RepID=A0A2Z2H445_9GAMM|nr:polyprenyl diphosphate synthase [Kushneria konosiri]ARS51938.1 di-trans,poly-cis-decaprenylcistransferase [Kushneria konosiri]